MLVCTWPSLPYRRSGSCSLQRAPSYICCVGDHNVLNFPEQPNGCGGGSPHTPNNALLNRTSYPRLKEDPRSNLAHSTSDANLRNYSGNCSVWVSYPYFDHSKFPAKSDLGANAHTCKAPQCVWGWVDQYPNPQFNNVMMCPT